MTQPPSSDIAFTPRVKALQTRLGSRRAYARMEALGGFRTGITPDLVMFLAAQRSFYLATVNGEGQPYIQHRGGPPGFLKVLDDHRLGFADYAGNRQYISWGNLGENPKVHLFFMDYTHRRRIKLWGTAEVIEDDPALIAALQSPEADGRPERAFVIKVAAWDINCPQHIPQRFEAADVAQALALRDQRIAALEAEIEALKAARV
jgi:predicted pyridoxine 5'-phosphate oxidase superfamily flavin-nucleotide-binding protein